MIGRREKFKVFGAILAMSVGGCALMELFRSAAPDRRFSHNVHLEKGLECKSCHTSFDKKPEAGMPVLKQCMLCHEGIDEQAPEEKRLATIYGPGPKWSQVTRLSPEIRFSHKTHHEAKLICSDCHRGIEAGHAVTASDRVSKDACMSCHAQRRLSNDCAFCHLEVRTDTPPPGHRLNWTQAHGGVVRAGHSLPYDNRCSLCHAESSCATCHQDQAPRDHTNFWRIQAHGVSAGVDRSRCVVCHRTDFCDRCHRESSPRNHTATWGSPRDNHCMTCHAPLTTQGCAMCHKGTPSHATAAPKPAWHTPGMNCRQCHGPGLAAPLPHPDNGGNCNACHY
jgi:hypothetical protein